MTSYWYTNINPLIKVLKIVGNAKTYKLVIQNNINQKDVLEIVMNEAEFLDLKNNMTIAEAS